MPIAATMRPTMNGARFAFGGWLSVSIDREHEQDEKRRADRLVDERPRPAVEVLGRERGEDAERGDLARLAPEGMRRLVIRVDRLLVVPLDERRGSEGSQELREDVVRRLRPRKLAPER